MECPIAPGSIQVARNPAQRESLLGCAGCTSIHIWVVISLWYVWQAVGDRAFGDFCICVRCGIR